MNLMPESQLNVVVVGHITHDDYGDSILPGGSAYYTSGAYFGLGANVRLVTSVGKDFLFKEVFEGLEVFNSVAEKTTTFKNYYPPNGPRIQKCLSQAELISPDLFPKDFDIDILHLAPVISEINIKKWAESLNPRLVVIGLQGFLRKINKDGDVMPAEWHPDKSESDFIDMLFLSEEDLAGHSHLLFELQKKFQFIALTKGRGGSTIYSNGKIINVGIYETIETDPTGAGDIYSAAFAYSRTTGCSVITSAKHASAAASIIVEGKGGSAMNRLREAFQRQDEVPVFSDQ
jgi:1D-myo-inositol 3-kinase